MIGHDCWLQGESCVSGWTHLISFVTLSFIGSSQLRYSEVTCYKLDNQGSISGKGLGFFCYLYFWSPPQIGTRDKWTKMWSLSYTTHYRMIGWQFGGLSRYSGVTDKNHNKSVRRACVPAEIRTGHLLDTNQVRYRLKHLGRCYFMFKVTFCRDAATGR